MTPFQDETEFTMIQITDCRCFIATANLKFVILFPCFYVPLLCLTTWDNPSLLISLNNKNVLKVELYLKLTRWYSSNVLMTSRQESSKLRVTGRCAALSTFPSDQQIAWGPQASCESGNTSTNLKKSTLTVITENVKSNHTARRHVSNILIWITRNHLTRYFSTYAARCC